MLKDTHCKICGSIKMVVISSEGRQTRTLDWYEYSNEKAAYPEDTIKVISAHCASCGIVYHKDSI